ncbi:hypothetical protein [Saccharopolyspora rosea]|uniref:Uncharacterized protein n=1 Tax=Saccharopolyspora rosea TaxID=524884 RepID=A0ABW3FRX7_9PSEU|nr:hypothetical protein [Saccharopolyspora rosea]
MLVVVLLLVVAAAAVLVTAVVSGHPEWAWLSVLLCGFGAVLLAVHRLRRRRAAQRGAGEPAFADVGEEPAREDTSEQDARTTADLDAEVLVIDERPRYHVEDCSWVGDRPTIPLALREARELGFTPCGRCTPDATLAARSRSAR